MTAHASEPDFANPIEVTFDPFRLFGFPLIARNKPFFVQGREIPAISAGIAPASISISQKMMFLSQQE